MHAAKTILMLLSICLLTTVALGNNAPAPLVIQFRLVVDIRTAQTEEMILAQPGRPPNRPEVINVQKNALLDQSDLKSATVATDNIGNPVIYINFTDDGTKRLAEVTRQNIGKRLAIVINGKLESAPRINSEISGGSAEITGQFTKEEAVDLATKINGSPVRELLTWSRIGFYCFAVLFVVATGIVVWIAILRKDASSAA